MAPAALPGSKNLLRETIKLQALVVFLTTVLPIEKLEKSLQINRIEAPRSYRGPALLPCLEPTVLEDAAVWALYRGHTEPCMPPFDAAVTAAVFGLFHTFQTPHAVTWHI